MTQEITTKTKCLLTKQGIEIWIDNNQAEKISELINKAEVKIIEIEGQTISVWSIEGMFDAEYVYRQRKVKAGMCECEFCKRWYPRFKECGCQGGRY